MGYLTQRKKEKRTDVMLKLIFVAILGLLLFSLYENGEDWLYKISALRFHYYILSFLVLVYCLYNKFFSYSLAFIFLGIACFTSISYSSRVLFNDSKKTGDELSIIYISSVRPFNYDATIDRIKTIGSDISAVNSIRKDKEQNATNMIFSNRDVIREGIIRLSSKYEAYFVVSQIDDKEMIFVDVDFSGISYSEAKLVFSNLTEFMKLQDLPVIIFGDFGIVSWSSVFTKFLAETNLDVKNRVVLSDGRFRFNPFTYPTINLLGYKNMGLEKIKFLPRGVNKEHPIMFKISY